MRTSRAGSGTRWLKRDVKLKPKQAATPRTEHVVCDGNNQLTWFIFFDYGVPKLWDENINMLSSLQLTIPSPILDKPFLKSSSTGTNIPDT